MEAILNIRTMRQYITIVLTEQKLQIPSDRGLRTIQA